MFTCLLDFIQGHGYGYKRYDEDTNSIIVVFIRHPQDDTEHLEHVERVKDLQDKKKKKKKKRIYEKFIRPVFLSPSPGGTLSCTFLCFPCPQHT